MPISRGIASLCLLACLLCCSVQAPVVAQGPILPGAPSPAYEIKQIDPPSWDQSPSPPGNAILIEDRRRRGASPTRAPRTISRTFARGEFAQCVQAAVAGVPVQTQCDVKTRWSDGSLRHVLISFWADLADGAAAQIDFLPHECDPQPAGLDKAAMLSFLGGRWDPIVEANAVSIDNADLMFRVRARDILSRWDGVENPTGVRYWMRGPIATQVIVEDKSADTPFDFGWKTGVPMTTLGADYNSTALALKTRDADGAVLRQWTFPLYVSVAQEVIRVCSLTGDTLQVCPGGRGALGTRAGTLGNYFTIIPLQGYAKAEEIRQRSIHPIFVLTFYPGWDGVKVETILENVWMDRIQDQMYSVRIRPGGEQSAPLYEHGGLVHNYGTRWRKAGWFGAEPAPIRIDHNTPYLIHSRVVPNYDLSIPFQQSALVAEMKKFNASDRGEPMGKATWQPLMPSAGGRHDIGLLPGQYVFYLYSWDASMQDVVEGMAAVSAHVPIHLREPAASDRRFNAYDEAPAAGRFVSVDARPTFFAYGAPPYARPETRPADALPPNIGIRGSSGWQPDDAHQPAMTYLSYALTGDFYHLEEMHFWSSFWIAANNPNQCNWCRHGSLGFISGQSRAQAWILRSLAMAVVMTPDGAPEKKYLHSKFQNNIAVREGAENITDGAFHEPAADCATPCLRSRWSIGRDIYGFRDPNVLHFFERGNSGLIDSTLDRSKLSAAASPWMMNFFHMVMGMAEDMGLGEVARLRRFYAANLIWQLQHPEFNPYLSSAYRIPTVDPERQFFTSWAKVLDAFTPRLQQLTTWTPLDTDCAECYSNMARGAASWLVGIDTPDGYSGTKAFLWIYRNMPGRKALMLDPKWAFLPRAVPEGFEPASGQARNPSWFKRDLSKVALSGR